MQKPLTNKGYIHLATDGNNTKVEHSDMHVYIMSHLFYAALKKIPVSYQAMLLAIERYKQEKTPLQ